MIASPGLAVLIGRIAVLRCALLAPPPTLTVSEWADAHRMVPSYSAEAGQWVTARTPYLREPMDSFSEIGVNRVVFKKCARIGATEAGLNIVGYFIDQDPSAIMIVQPTADDAKDFSKEQLGPTITETPVLHAKVSDAVKDAKNTITKKVFPGGSVKLGGANSPRFFRRITARVIILEEVNGYGKSKTAKGEGDQIKLAEKRAETHGYRAKVYINSTPTTKGECRISQEFAKSDQRYYHVPCPHCGHAQRLVWERLRYKDLPAPQYQCAGCDQLIDESDKDAMVAQGVWVATVPQHTTRGYHLNALYSPFVRWSKLVEEWIDAQGDSEALQVFTNTALGEEWEDREAEDIQSALKMRALRYDGRTGDEPFAFHVPRGACLLACGVDKQPGELHYVVRAIGPTRSPGMGGIFQQNNRNKRSIVLDLKQPAAQDIVRQLAAESDVVIENFRPGAMEGWNLGPDELLAANPKLIVLRISGYGQTGPYRDKPGFGVVAEAMGGLRHLSGEPGRTPVRVGVSIGDTLAALHGVIGILMALHERQRSGRGRYSSTEAQTSPIAQPIAARRWRSGSITGPPPSGISSGSAAGPAGSPGRRTRFAGSGGGRRPGGSRRIPPSLPRRHGTVRRAGDGKSPAPPAPFVGHRA